MDVVTVDHATADVQIDVAVPSDGSPDAGDAGADASAQAPALADYANAVDVAYCKRLHECCSPDPGQTWLQDDCVAIYHRFNGVFGQYAYKSALDGGGIVYDRNAAALCLSTVAGFNCGRVSSAVYTSVIDICFGATQGTLGIATGVCVDSLQCKPGEYCALLDGGSGTCVALSRSGQQCLDTIQSSDCVYRGTGSPSLYCGQTDAGPACLPTKPNNVACNAGGQCQSRLCDTKGVGCAVSYGFSDRGDPNGICAGLTVDGGIAVPDAATSDAASD